MVNILAAGVACALGVVVCYVNQSGVLVVTLICLVAYLATQAIPALRTKRPHPPGPPGWPIIRNLLQIPQDNPWLVYSAWADTYGDVVHLEALNDHLVILNTVQAAKDLLDGRSTIYSDRPESVRDLCFGVEMPMLSYNDQWRRQRKIVAQSFNPGLVPRYYPIQEHEARRLAQGILQRPETLVSQTKTRIAAIIMRVTYGYAVKGEDDPMITVPFDAMVNFGAATEPGAWIVDFIPQLQYLPRWTPGASFLRTAERFKELEHKASWNPYLWCKQRLQEGFTDTCLVASTLKEFEGKMNNEDEGALVWAASSGLGGGLDTNMSTTFTFLLAMVRHPDVQAKAQAEIDQVVGSERLPSITDRPSLPYVRSVITEVFRWYPPTPLGLPHALRQDDVYKDCLLPKSSIIIPNVWRMLRDPKVYPEPDMFKPERFGNDDGEMRKVIDLVFGFGRRACPGSQFAEGSIFAIVATILATSNVVPKMDERGKPIIPEMQYTNGIIVFPKHIVCDIKPRSMRAQELLEECISRSE
ncbi:cytochrome P450 [Fomitopsis serialis]|uniref:cytochrome P450 n=1 Tax=Fomitopsis serialis TaxID=139415 RepID=UPI002008AB3B|nr:cytochrome P450 [Neoantrodia serialis]KAH9934348.1 cytochrome P450 [Neoantrodia serialis]